MATTATFDISKFTGTFKAGGARPNLFEVKITGNPASLSVPDNFQFLCKASQLPVSTIGTIEVPYFGRSVRVAGDREFTEFTTTVINDESFGTRNLIEKWINLLNTHKGNKSVVNLGDRSSSAGYTGTLELHTYTKKGANDQKWEFLGCWPSNVSTIDLNWDSVNTLQEYTITWQYDTYLHLNAKVGKN